MTATSRSTVRSRWRPGLSGLVVLAVLPCGCAPVRPGLPDAILVSRILAPAGVGAMPIPKVDTSQPQITTLAKLGQPESLPSPRKMPANADAPPGSENPPTADAGQDAVPLGHTPPLTLDDAIALAFQFQPRLRLFQERVEQARSRGDAAFAAYLPQVTYFNRGFVGENPTGPAGGFGLPLPEFSDAPGYQTYAVSELFMQWTLWDFGRTTGRYRQAGIGIDIAQLQAVRTSQTVVFEVATAYFRLLEAQATLRVSQEAVRLAESVLDVTRKSLNQGLVLRDAVLRGEVQLAQARRAVVAAQRTRLVAVASLNQAIGINVSAPTEIVDRSDQPPFHLTLAESLQLAVDNRREFQVARRAIEQAAEGERVAKAEFAPRVYFEGVAAEQDGHQSLHGASETASINISWKLYQGGQRIADLRNASAGVRAAADQAQVVCDTIALEVNQAYRAVEAARQSIDLARPAVDQARENLRLVTFRYENGNATPTDIVDAETSLTRAQQDLYTSQYEFLSALTLLDYASGTTPFRGPERPK
jgi:outer membrane protein